MLKKIVYVAGVLFISLVKPLAYAQDKGCSLSALGQPLAMLNRPMSLKKIPNFITDYYSEEELKGFRDKDKLLAKNAYAQNKGIGRENLSPSGSVEGYLNQIAKRLLREWPHANPPFTIKTTAALRNSPSITEDLVILFPVGYLALAQSEDEIAFILAHELGHALFSHADVIAKKSAGKASLRKFKSLINTSLVVHEGLIKNEDGSFKKGDDERELRKLNSRAQVYYERSRQLMSDFAHPAWQARQEDEADLLGAELLMRAGYSFEGIPQAFQTLERIKNDACLALKEFSSSMQSFVDDELNSALTKFAENPNVDLQGQFIAGLKGISRKQVENAMLQQALPKTHRKFGKRLSRIEKYSERDVMQPFYESAISKFPEEGLLAKIRANASYKKLYDSALAFDQMDKALADDELKVAAEKLAKVDMSTQYGRFLKFKLRRSQGKQSTAVENLNIALNARTPSLSVIEESLAYKLQSRQFKSANTLIGRAETLYSDEVYFLPERIYIAKLENKEKGENAAKLLLDCIDSGRDAMEDVCFAASTVTDPHFRRNAGKILERFNCKSNESTGGDVECVAKTPGGNRSLGLPGLSGVRNLIPGVGQK